MVRHRKAGSALFEADIPCLVAIGLILLAVGAAGRGLLVVWDNVRLQAGTPAAEVAADQLDRQLGDLEDQLKDATDGLRELDQSLRSNSAERSRVQREFRRNQLLLQQLEQPAVETDAVGRWREDQMEIVHERQILHERQRVLRAELRAREEQGEKLLRDRGGLGSEIADRLARLRQLNVTQEYVRSLLRRVGIEEVLCAVDGLNGGSVSLPAVEAGQNRLLEDLEQQCRTFSRTRQLNSETLDPFTRTRQ